MSDEDILVTFKHPHGQNYEIALKPSMTVLQTKELSEEKCSIPVSLQRLIYRGRILKDPETLQSYGVTNGQTIHVVRINSYSSTPSDRQPAAPTAPVPPQPTPTLASDPVMGALGGGLDGQTAPPPLGMLFGDNLMGMNPQTLQALMSNPAVTSMMQEFMRNPELIRSMMQGTPLFNSMATNPAVQSMLSNPEMMRTLLSPETLQSVMNLQQTMNVQRAGVTGMAAPTTTPGDAAPTATATATHPTTAEPQVDIHNIDELISRVLRRPPQQPNPNDAARFESQLQQLEEMGFIDRDANLLALQRTDGDVNGAVSWLLEADHGR